MVTFAPMLCHLIQPRELFGPPERQDELRKCWAMNDAVFTDQTHPADRPTFTELFRMCKPAAFNIIANSDIYFSPHTFDGFDDRWFDVRVCMALSRWDVLPNGEVKLHDHCDSQDSWIVYGGPHEVDAPFPMGVPGCDNALLYSLQVAGFKVSNPSKTIRTYHLHNSAHRTYLSDENGHGRGGKKMYRIPPPYAFAKPTEL